MYIPRSATSRAASSSATSTTGTVVPIVSIAVLPIAIVPVAVVPITVLLVSVSFVPCACSGAGSCGGILRSSTTSASTTATSTAAAIAATTASPTADTTTDSSPTASSATRADAADFMCCNNGLEDLMRTTYDQLRGQPEFLNCNVHRISNEVQTRAEAQYNTTFEVIVGIGDYASKSHFFHNLICKIEREGRSGACSD
ncbi:Protein GRD-15 [Aphelenchoides avenae]|nr:Protein GRD-15 [Aphelenchus avenae]